MSFRPEVLEQMQVGVESSFGTAIDADKRLYGLKWDLDPVIPTETDMAQGSKSPVGVVVGKERTDVSFSGNAALNDLLYIFSTILETPTITTPTNGVLTRLFTFFPDTHDADTLESLTIERGSSLGASRVAGFRADDFEITFTPEKSVDIKGKGFGKALADSGVTMTASPDDVPKVTMHPRGIGVYLATSEAGLSAGRIKPLEAKFGVKDRFTPVYSLDETETSFQDTVEKGLGVTGQIVIPMDSTAAGYMDELRAADTRFLQIVWTGATIESVTPTYNYKAEITFPFNFTGGKRGARSDAYCATFDLVGIDDPTFGGSVRVRIYTEQTAL